MRETLNRAYENERNIISAALVDAHKDLESRGLEGHEFCWRFNALEDEARRLLQTAQRRRSEGERNTRMLTENLQDLRADVLKLAAVALTPYVRALLAIEDAGRVLELARQANGESFEWGSPGMRVALYDDGGAAFGSYDRAPLCWPESEPRHVRRTAEEIKDLLRDGRNWGRVPCADDMVNAGLLDKVNAALTYIGMEEQ